MYALYIFGALIIIFFIIEFRIRKPDHITLAEHKGQIKRRRGLLFPRHFSLTIPAKTHLTVQEIEAEAQGRIRLKVRLAFTVAASLEHLGELIRVGGWDKNAVVHATEELQLIMNTLVREFTEKYKIDELLNEKLSDYLKLQLKEFEAKLGLEIISVNVQAIEPVDEKIAEAIRKHEAIRILEQTEIENQKARVSVAKVKIEADEKIANYENDLDLKKYELQKLKQEKEVELNRKRVEEELKLRNLQLEVDRKEVEFLIKNPELLVLTPQVTKLVEASQSLRNARTVVSLSSKEITENSDFLNILKSGLHNLIKAFDNDTTADKKQLKSQQK